MNQIPIELQAVPIPPGTSAADMNQLLAIIAGNLEAFISANVSFFLQGTVTPSTNQTALFFNQSQGIFYYWDTGTGKYLPITPFNQGDTKYTFISGDDVNHGWIQLDGRLVTAVAGISANQLAVLQSLFGASGTLPVVKPLQALSNLPGSGSFSDISNPGVTPAAGQFSGLTVNSPPQQSDLQATNQNAETLDVSARSTQEALTAVIAQCEAMLDALNGAGGPTMFAKVFVGYP